jgi:hypothetical protein
LARLMSSPQVPVSAPTRGSRWLWVLLILVATGLRLPAPDWDGGIAAHPDERYLLGAAAETPAFGNVCAAVTDFPYGHLPVSAAQVLIYAAPDADPLYAARLLSGLIGVAIVAIAGGCGRHLAGSSGGLLTTAIVAVSPFLIQQARFYTVDPFGTLLVSAAVLAAARKRWRSAGSYLGLAMACKVSLALALVPIWAAAVGHPNGDRIVWRRGTRVLVFTALAFLAAAPWTIVAPVACWRGPIIQSMMASGRFVLPYTRQYAGTLPYVYPLVQMGLWGLGPMVTILGALGLVVGAVRVRRLSLLAREPAWVWVTAYFLLVAMLSVKFPRYLLPLYPWWSAWASLFLIWLRRLGARRITSALVFLSLASSALLGLAQATLYREPHTWVAASEWIGTTVPKGSTLGIEEWDHPLPVPTEKVSPSDYSQIMLQVLDEESPAKTAELTALSAQASWIVLASRRGYGALGRDRQANSATLAWYRELLGTEGVHIFARCPKIGPLAVTDDPFADAGLPTPGGQALAARCGTPLALRLPRLDESYRVYDAPTVVVVEVHP